jgi:hypothetical protein
MKLTRCFTYKTFNPNTNDFDNEGKAFTKEVDQQTEKAIKRNEWLQHFCLYLWFPFFIATLTFACLADTYWDWRFAVGAVACFVAIVWASINIVTCETKNDTLKEHFRELNFEEEYEQCIAYNLEQEQVAIQWRAAHPFEEKIRMAQTRGSSVDVAEMVKEYIKLQKGE